MATTPHHRRSRGGRRRTGVALASLTLSLSALHFRCPADAFAPPPPPHAATTLSRRMSASLAMPMPGFDNDERADNRPARAKGAPIRTSGETYLPRLTQREEVALLRRMRSHPPDSQEHKGARRTLLLRNLPLVKSIVMKVMNSGAGGSTTTASPSSSTSSPSAASGASRTGGWALTRDDLVHEGTIGLAEAIDRYDLKYAADVEGDGTGKPTSGAARLGTYATFWIRARVLRAIRSREHALFRFPERVSQACNRLVGAAAELGLTWDEVAVLADYDVLSAKQEKLRVLLKDRAGIETESLFREAVRVRSMRRSGPAGLEESWMSPRASSTVGEDEDMLRTFMQGAGQSEHIRETLSKFLVPREVEVLSLRYGLVATAAEDEAGEEEVATLSQRGIRDYQAEAEADLFGPGGVLAHYSETPRASSSAFKAKASAATTSAVGAATPRNVMNAPSAPILPRIARGPSALLPFKEVGRRLSFSGEYCRRTCAAALEKLTRAAEEGRLAESDFLLGW